VRSDARHPNRCVAAWDASQQLSFHLFLFTVVTELAIAIAPGGSPTETDMEARTLEPRRHHRCTPFSLLTFRLSPMATSTTRAITPTHGGPFSAPNRATTPIAANTTAHARNSNSNSNSSAQFGAHLTKSPRGLSPQPLTGAAALNDERSEKSRQTTPNPAVAIVQNLLGTTHPAISRPKDAPEPAQMSAPLERAAKSIVIPQQVSKRERSGRRIGPWCCPACVFTVLAPRALPRTDVAPYRSPTTTCRRVP
jgi:hypothetical protein